MGTYEKHSDPSEEKQKLPPPEILSDVYTDEATLCIDLKDSEGRYFTLCNATALGLRRSLRYFKTLDLALIDAKIPSIDIPMKNWRARKGVLCVVCQRPARRKPSFGVVEYGCPKCLAVGPVGELFVIKEQPKKEKLVEPKPKADKPVPKPPEAVKAEKSPQAEVPQLVGMSLKDRLAARKAKQS